MGVGEGFIETFTLSEKKKQFNSSPPLQPGGFFLQAMADLPMDA